jgi:hypothetical protein
MKRIQKFLQETVGLSANLEKLPDSQLKKLPMYLEYGYNYYLLTVEGHQLVLAYVDENLKTAGQLKKQSHAMSNLLNLPVAFVMDNQSSQLKRRLIQEKIGFIVPESQVYLPQFLISLTENARPVHSFPELLSPSAQLLLLYHLQKEYLEPFSLKEIAQKLDYTPKTITKIAAELKSKNLCQIIGTKEKRLVFIVDRKQLWTMAEPQMQQPISKVFFADSKDKVKFCQSGDAALAHYTFLAETGKEAYAIYKPEFEELKEKKYWEYIDELEGDVRIEVWKYNPRILSINGYIDPLSLYLCYREDTNERVAAEINELIHNRKW